VKFVSPTYGVFNNVNAVTLKIIERVKESPHSETQNARQRKAIQQTLGLPKRCQLLIWKRKSSLFE